MAATTKKAVKTAAVPPSNAAADALLAMLIEIGGLVVVTVVAGISDSIANLMIIFIIGIAILWAVTHYAQLSGLITALNNAEKAA